MRRVRRSVDVKVLLVGLPLLAALPVLAYAGFLLHVNARQVADHEKRDQAATHDALQATLRRELAETQRFLTMLAASPAMSEATGDVARAGTLAERMVDGDFGIRALAILDRSGAVLVEYPRRDVRARTVPLAPQQLRVFDTGEGALSDLYDSPLDRQLGVSIDVPVVRGGRVLWVVTAALDPARLSRTLSAQVGPREALATVLDSHRRIVARTGDLQRWYGELPSRDTLDAAASGERGWRRFQTRDGEEYVWTWSTLPAGWTVWFGSPARAFGGALRGSMLRLGAAGVAVLLLAMAAAALLACRIAASADRIADDARQLTEGERPAYRPSGIRQLDMLCQALEDASDRVSRALEAERTARAVADEHNRAKDLFLGMLSHELRNPLAPIRSSIYVLRHVPPGSDHHRRAQEMIERQTEHLTRLVDDLLDVTRIARGKIELLRSRVDLREVVRRAADDHRAAMDDRGIAFGAVLPRDEVWANADATRITQVVGNLLNNAAKFTPRGGEVTLSLEVDGHDATIRVRDTGAGIAPELLPRVFDAFFQGERTAARTEGGLGLGLALVKGITELHGGTVRAESAGKDQGAEFVVRLPLAEAASG